MQNKIMRLVVGLGLITGSICSVYAQSDADYYQLAREAGKKNNFAKATEYCLTGLKKTPMDMDLKEYLGKCYLETGKLDQARITLLDVLRKSPDRDDARRYMITIESLAKRNASAICYVNELLETNPYDKDLWLKKVNLYRELHNNVEAEKSISRLLQIFPNDPGVRNTYQTIVKENASTSLKKENLEEAAMQYQNALLTSKRDPEMFDNLINTQIKLGDYHEALNSTNKALFFMPNHAGFLGKKASILEAQGNYNQAIAVLEQSLKRNNNPQLRKQLDYLISESARTQANNDPYVLYGKIYAKNKGDQEAFKFLLNTAMERGKYDDAQALLSPALRQRPNDKSLLLKQVQLFERTQQNAKAEALYERLFQLYPNDSDIAAKYNHLRYNQARIALINQEYLKAESGFLLTAKDPAYSDSSNENLFKAYVGLKNKEKAMLTIDKLINRHPEEEKYPLMKIEFLRNITDYPPAYEAAKQFHKTFPNSKNFPEELDLLANQYIKALMAQEKYNEVIVISDYVISVNPDRLQPYLYGLNARVSQNKMDESVGYIQQALLKFPSHKDLRMRLAGIQGEMNNHKRAAEILGDLRREYQYNDTISNAWAEEMFLYGKALESEGKKEEAIATYFSIVQDKPNDLATSLKLLALMNEEKQHQRAMQLVDQCLQHHPNQNDLIFQKAVIYENTGDWNNALIYYEQYVPTVEKLETVRDHIKYLKSKNYKNSITASFTNVKSDSILLNIPVASLEYAHRVNEWNTFIIRGNYAGKNSGVGVQGEIDWYHGFKNKSSFLINAGVSNRFFQKYKVALSYFQPFGQGWQAELGGRYAKLSNNADFYTGIVGLEKTWNSTWLNGKALFMSDGDKNYYNFLLQSRFYMVNDRDYFSVMASIGNAPEDQRLDFQLNNFLSYANSMVGAGYRHHLSYKSAIGFLGTWSSYKMTPTAYINQYNVSLLFTTKF